MVEVLYEDNHLLALNKPCGLPTQSDDNKSLENDAKAYVKQAQNKPGNVFLHPIHRLDKPTSGVVLFAKTSKALSRLQEMMRQHKIQKTYVAICEGKISPQEGTLEHLLLHDDHKATVHKSGKPAILHYKVIGSPGNHSIVEVQLVTGRYHQIRAQFQAIHHPILGDKKYGSHHPYKPDAIALHHKKMSFTHPVTHELLEISAPTPFMSL